MSTNPQQEAFLKVCLYAAIADGGKSPAEHEALNRLTSGQLPDIGPVVQEALRRRVSAAELAAQLADPAARQGAYEAAVAVCEADGPLVSAERWYLDEVRVAFGLEAQPAAEVVARAEALATAPLDAPPLLAPGLALGAAALPGETGPAPATPGALDPAREQELDSMILNYAILNGGLELLPDSLATLAIIPLQMKMVYRVGKAYGYELDQGHIRDFLATAGVGMASQVVESYVEKLARGLLGKFAGGWGSSLVGQMAGSGMSFATTYALGQLARRYYAGGRTLAAIDVRGLFSSLVSEGQNLQGRYGSQIAEASRSVNLGSLASLVRGR